MNTTRLPSLFAPEALTFDDAFRAFMRPFRWDTAPEVAAIPVEVVEMDDAYVVTAMIPGVTKEAIHVEIDGRQVMIATEFKKPAYEKEGRLLRTEMNYGFSSRVFMLGMEIDREKATAKYVDGVLTLTLPKMVAATTEPLKIL